jgi:hypothetical protein
METTKTMTTEQFTGKHNVELTGEQLYEISHALFELQKIYHKDGFFYLENYAHGLWQKIGTIISNINNK